MNSALELLAEFEKAVADGFPTGAQGADVLDQLERISKLLDQVKDFYKNALTKDPGCVPGWTLRPGAMRRTLGDPAKVWERMSDKLSSADFMSAVQIQVGRLQEVWARRAGVPPTKARSAFDELLGELVQLWPSAPTLIRTK